MTGNKVEFKSHVKDVMGAIHATERKRMEEAVMEVRNTTLKTLSGPRSGRTYNVPGTHRTYTASAPGEAPAQATGRLRQNVATEIEEKGKDFIGSVGTTLEYGKTLEFGDSRIAPRPWLKPSFEQTVSTLKKIFGGRWFP